MIDYSKHSYARTLRFFEAQNVGNVIFKIRASHFAVVLLCSYAYNTIIIPFAFTDIIKNAWTTQSSAGSIIRVRWLFVMVGGSHSLNNVFFFEINGLYLRIFRYLCRLK